MKLSSKAQKIHSQLNAGVTKLGDLRKIAKEIKVDHNLALELWSSGEFYSRHLAILIMDKKLLNQEFINQIDKDIQNHEYDERLQLADWLMANQLTKDKNTIALIETWENSPSIIQRRILLR
jgi:3-methyladenine DNA glycosylase AlkD